MIRKISAAMVIAGLCIGASLSAKATLVLNKDTEGTTPFDVWFDQEAQPSDQQLADALGLSLAEAPKVIWKHEFDSGEVGPYYSYDVVFDPEDGTGKAIITWDETLYVNTAKPTYLLVKDGDAGSYLWILTSPVWDGKETIEILDMFPGGGSAISHVEIGGSGAYTDTVIPEPTTVIAGALLLLPFGLSTIRRLRRNK